MYQKFGAAGTAIATLALLAAGWIVPTQAHEYIPGQRTLRVGFSYDCGRIGIPGFSGFVNYARGAHAEDPVMGATLPDSDEIDVTLDYRRDRMAHGIRWLRVCAARINFDGRDSAT